MKIAIINDAGDVLDSFEFTNLTPVPSIVDAINSGLDSLQFTECNYCSCLGLFSEMTDTTFGMVACKACLASL